MAGFLKKRYVLLSVQVGSMVILWQINVYLVTMYVKSAMGLSLISAQYAQQLLITFMRKIKDVVIILVEEPHA